MNKANECTCPSGDGSLVHPCPAHPAVEPAEGEQGEREAKPGLFCRACGGRLAVRGVCSIYCPACEARAALSQEPAALLYRKSDKGDRAWSVTCDPHYMNFFRKADGYESKLLFDAALAQPSPAQAEQAEGAHVPDEVFAGVFAEWWEEEGQYCRAGGGDYERTFAFQAWRHLYPLLLQARAALAQPSPAPAEAERPEMSPERAAYFMRRFKSEEKLLGPNEQAAVDYVLSLLAQHDRIVGPLRYKAELYDEVWALVTGKGYMNVTTAISVLESERDAALARVAKLEHSQSFQRDIDYSVLSEYADKHRLHFNNLCAVVRSALIALPAQAQHSVPEGLAEFSQFLSAVMDAAGLVRYGRRSKELSEYLGAQCMKYRLSAPVAQAGQVPAAWYYDAPSQAEAAIIDIRGMWGEDDCPTYEDVAAALRRLLAAAPAQAQHSVPEEFIGRLSEFLAQRGTTGKALLRELRAMLAAAPAQGRE
ncbi:TPA: hypothetical protein NIG64_001787 [Pseudomonas aeruginosa]|nr:hypothetical protein [Pseudomonas aeruginosa]